MQSVITCGYRFPPAIIQYVGLYVGSTLSFRDVEDLLAERGIAVSHETIRRWVAHFGPIDALASCQASHDDPMDLGEVFMSIAGRQTYRWRADEGERLNASVEARRDEDATLRYRRLRLAA